MNKRELLIRLLKLDVTHTKKVFSSGEGVNQDYFHIDELWNIMLEMIGLDGGLDYIYDKYSDELIRGKDENIEGFADYLLAEAKSYREDRKDQSIEKRLVRLKNTECPIHGYPLYQDSPYETDKEGRDYCVAGCPVKGCVQTRVYDFEGDNELLPEWQHLMWEE